MSLPGRIAAGLAAVSEKAAGLAPLKLAAGLAVTAGVLAGGVTAVVREAPPEPGPAASARPDEGEAAARDHQAARERVRSALLPPAPDSPPATTAPEPERAPEAASSPRLDALPRPGWPSAEMPGGHVGGIVADAPAAAAPSEAPPAEPARPEPAEVQPPQAAVAPPVAAQGPAQAGPQPWTSTPQPEMRGRGEDMLSKGDVAQARLWLSAAADKGDAEAMMRLAETYDPAVLGTWRVVGLTSDPAQARALYERALSGGVEAAREPLARLGGR